MCSVYVFALFSMVLEKISAILPTPDLNNSVCKVNFNPLSDDASKYYFIDFTVFLQKPSLIEANYAAQQTYFI